MEEMGASEIVEQIEDMNIYQTGKVFNLKKHTDRLALGNINIVNE